MVVKIMSKLSLLKLFKKLLISWRKRVSSSSNKETSANKVAKKYLVPNSQLKVIILPYSQFKTKLKRILNKSEAIRSILAREKSDQHGRALSPRLSILESGLKRLKMAKESKLGPTAPPTTATGVTTYQMVTVYSNKPTVIL